MKRADKPSGAALTSRKTTGLEIRSRVNAAQIGRITRLTGTEATHHTLRYYWHTTLVSHHMLPATLGEARRLSQLAISLTLAVLVGALAADAQRRRGPRPPGKRPRMSDTVKANIYADNWFEMYINGKLIAVDSIEFIPHNIISVDILPQYPMTIAVLAKDFADAQTGLEYNNTRIGDGGLILKFGDGTVTSKAWKAKKVFWGPLNGDIENPKVRREPIPDGW